MKYEENIKVKMSLPTAELVKFEITVPKEVKWIVIGLGNQTKESDLFMIEHDQQHTAVMDMYSDGQGRIFTDNTNDYLLKIESTDNDISYSVTRKLNTEDDQDTVIVNGFNDVFFAYGSGESPSELIHLDADSFVLEIATVNRNLSSGPATSKTKETALLHGLFTYIAWNWFSLLLIITGRYSKYFYSVRIWVHFVLGLLAVIFNLIGVAFSDVGYENSQNALGDAHTGLAGVVSWWAGGVSIIGIFSKVCSRYVRHMSFLTTWSRLVHIITSWLLIVYAQFVMLSGLYLYNSPMVPLFYTHVAIMVVIGVVLEIIFCFMLKNWKYEYINVLHEKILPEMSIKHFLDSEKKLALFDNYVVDMGGYYWEHPGTAYVLEECVKMDVGKYFFGSYTMENMIKPVRHSYIAGKVLMRLIVAKLVQPKENGMAFRKSQENVETDKSDSRLKGEDITPTIYESSMIFAVTTEVEHIPNVFHVGFGNRQTQVKMFFPGTEMLGRHYVINSLQNQICRYYTICNAMHTKVFPQYLSCFKGVLEGSEIEREYDSFKTIDDAWDDKLELVIKYYEQSKNGITKQLLQHNREDRFFISGPLSRGYDLTSDNMSGTTVIFVGGTGVLPYMDFFAYLTRKIINKHDSSHEVFPGEQFEDELDQANFVVYGYYPKAADACAIEFCNQASQIFEKFEEQEKFSFIPRYTRDGDKRLDKDQIMEILGKHKEESGLKNVWVCGPPPMNNMFQEYKKMLCKEFDLHHMNIEIL
ncbi:unnamed protein product [Moneuplotes crassus]|uniref:DOMON domain-containing protein n=2 Tax=Euplotes crassus TaxID=5936 RepID=A0AAD1YB70_EUPCR|nr:unnamed protein product [Moneuplotes crassus]